MPNDMPLAIPPRETRHPRDPTPSAKAQRGGELHAAPWLLGGHQRIKPTEGPEVSDPRRGGF